MNNQLIMITGSGPGAGKTTLMSEIAGLLRDHNVPVLEVSEDTLWGKRQLGWDPIELTGVWPEFRELLHEPLRQRPLTSADLLNTFQRLQDQAISSDAVWIQDWSWLDLAVLWAKTDERLLARFSAELQILTRPLRPAVLYLVTNPALALQRAVAERGVIWLERHAESRVPAAILDERLPALAAVYRQKEQFHRRILEGGGWAPVYLDADSSRQEVFRAALIALGLRA